MFVYCDSQSPDTPSNAKLWGPDEGPSEAPLLGFLSTLHILFKPNHGMAMARSKIIEFTH